MERVRAKPVRNAKLLLIPELGPDRISSVLSSGLSYSLHIPEGLGWLDQGQGSTSCGLPHDRLATTTHRRSRADITASLEHVLRVGGLVSRRDTYRTMYAEHRHVKDLRYCVFEIGWMICCDRYIHISWYQSVFNSHRFAQSHSCRNIATTSKQRNRFHHSLHTACYRRLTHRRKWSILSSFHSERKY
jgi:hypothetical protein